MYNKFSIFKKTIVFAVALSLLCGCTQGESKSDDVSELSSEGAQTSESIIVSSETEPEATTDNQNPTAPAENGFFFIGVADTKPLSSYSGEIDESVTRIAKAYLEKNESLITDSKELEIYNECVRLIKKLITEDMTEYEKELAIHNYIITHAQYDLDELSPFKEVSEDSFTPYGILFNKKGVCLAYTRTFQLFMDMLGIECITVHSTANDYEEHAWNMVRLDDRWYHVDVTWDDPIPDNGPNPVYNFFNVTDEIMVVSHQWDASQFPKADSTAYNYYVMVNMIAENQQQFEEILLKEINDGKTIVSVLVKNDFKASFNFLSAFDKKASSYSVKYNSNYSSMTVFVK